MARATKLGTATILAAALVLGAHPEPAAAQVSVGVGVSVALPAGHAWVRFGGERYAYHDGWFYRPYRTGRYIRVAPPIGAMLTWIPEDAQLCYYDGLQYYVYRDVWYEPEYLDDGTLVYLVAAAPYGIRTMPYYVRTVPYLTTVRVVRVYGYYDRSSRLDWYRDLARYRDRDWYRTRHDHDRYARDRYGRDRYDRGRSGAYNDRANTRDRRVDTRVRLRVPAARVPPQPRRTPEIRQWPQARPGAARPAPRTAPRVTRPAPATRPGVARPAPRARSGAVRPAPRARSGAVRPAPRARSGVVRPAPRARPRVARPAAPVRSHAARPAPRARPGAAARPASRRPARARPAPRRKQQPARGGTHPRRPPPRRP
ncbi:MAG TPA: DUF6515 family protein [Longimicrobiales bacterium]|nr:DUF6515 family protein [Longimicrobiales bacterium]